MGKKLAIGRVLAILGGIGAIVVFFFGAYIVDRNAPKFVYFAPGDFFLMNRAPFERMLDILAELSLCGLPHVFGLLVILYCAWFIWKKEKGDLVVYIVNYVFTALAITVILHNLALREVLTLSVYRTHFWSAFFLAIFATIVIHVGLNLLTKSKYVTVLSLLLMMSLGALSWFIAFFAELKSLAVQPDQQPVGLYVALAAYFFVAVGIVFLYLAELDRKKYAPAVVEERPLTLKEQIVAKRAKAAAEKESAVVAAAVESAPDAVPEGEVAPAVTVVAELPAAEADPSATLPEEPLPVEPGVSPDETMPEEPTPVAEVPAELSENVSPSETIVVGPTETFDGSASETLSGDPGETLPGEEEKSSQS